MFAGSGEDIQDSLIRKIALDSSIHEIILAGDGYGFEKYITGQQRI